MNKREAFNILGIKNFDVSPEHLRDCYLYKMASIQKYKQNKFSYESMEKQIEDAYQCILEIRRKEKWFVSDIDYREFMNYNVSAGANPYFALEKKQRHPFLHGVLLFFMIMLSILGVIFLIIIFSVV